MAFHCVRCKAPIDKSFRACPHCGEPVTDFLRRYTDEPIDGKYEIVDRLGAGGMGDVYKVRHVYLNALRVIKVIRSAVSESQEAHERFLREARVATKVQHPNVATLHDFSALPDGSHYMVWEYIEGENLAQLLRSRGTLTPRQAAQLTIQALEGLDAIHRAGIVHRDISPENLMITRDASGEDRVKIIDLGVAKSDEVENVTRTGVFVGKFRYASPEHLGFMPDGEKIDGRADLYSLAIVLYEMLSGRPPFEAKSPHEYILLHSRDTAFRPLEIPSGLAGGPELETILRKALDRDREKRFANARELARALEEVASSLPDPHLDKTFAIPAPGDATMRLTGSGTLERETVRSEQATLRTPLPNEQATVRRSVAVPVAPATQPATELPAPAPAPARRSILPAILVAFTLLAVLSIAAFGAVWFLRSRKASPQAPPVASDKTNTVAGPPVEAARIVDVVAPPPATTTTMTTAATETIATTVTNEPARPVEPEERRDPAPATATHAARDESTREPVVEPPPRRDPPANVRTYVEGGDSDANDAALEELRQQLAGISAIAIAGEGDPAQTQQLTSAVARMRTISPDARVVIHFNGTLERLGRGRKRRAVDATISKNGRTIFRYVMAPNDYRAGDTPAEAFASVLGDALEE